ncbi:hypothetical protein R3P38DRAFT_2480007, partial [Favolaschia claudopus]
VTDLGKQDFAPGLSFVAISGAKTLKGISFRSPFVVERLQRPNETAVRQMLRAGMDRRVAV